jgi:hypothetical protein
MRVVTCIEDLRQLARKRVARGLFWSSLAGICGPFYSV